MGARFESDPASLIYQDETLPPLTPVGAKPLVLGGTKFLSGSPRISS